MATDPQMFIKIAANIEDLKTAMAQARQAVIDQTAATQAATEAAAGWGASLDKLGGEMLLSVTSGQLLADALIAIGVAVKDALDAIPEFVAHTIDLGNSLYEMSMKTGASVESLSALRYVASQTGMDFETLTSSFFKMEAALGATGPKADKLAASLEGVGLNLQNLKNESPDEAFIQLVSALENVGNAADRNALAMQLFGKGAKNMAGLFHDDIYAMMDDAKSLGLIITTEDAAAAHAADVGWKAFTMQLDAAGMKMADSVLPGLVAIEGLLSGAFQTAVQNTNLKFGDLNSIVKTVLDTVLKFGEGGVDVAKALYDGFVAVSPVFELLAKAIASFTTDALQGMKDIAVLGAQLPGTAGKDFAQMALAINTLQLGLSQGADGAAKFTAALHDGQPAADALFAGLKTGIETVRVGLPAAFDQAAVKIADFAKKSHDAAGNFDSDVDSNATSVKELAKTQALADAAAMAGYAARIKQLQDLEKASAKAYGFDEAVAGLARLAVAEEAETEAVYATVTSEKDRMKLIEQNYTRQIEITTQIMTLEDKHAKLVNAAVLTELDAQIKLNAAHGENAVGAILIQDNALTILTKSLDALHARAIDGISQKAQEQTLEEAYSKSLYDEAVAQDLATTAMLSGTTAIKDRTVAQLALQAAMTGTVTSQFSLNPLDRSSWDAKIASFGPSARAAQDSDGNWYVYVPGVNAAPARAEGGAVTAGRPYTVGERGPELFIPQQSGTIQPNGAGGTTIVQHIYITQPLGTPAQIAAALNTAQTGRLKAIGIRLPGGN